MIHIKTVMKAITYTVKFWSTMYLYALQFEIRFLFVIITDEIFYTTAQK